MVTVCFAILNINNPIRMGTIRYDVIATKIGSTLLPNNLIYSIVKIIMKIISSDIT